MLAYLAYRFEWRFGLAAVIATAHDILATIALHRRDAARGEPDGRGGGAVDGGLLAQRHDHHLRPGPREPEEAQEGHASSTILNRSINETLPRSVLTHGTTLATLLALAIFGGEVIRPFALVMFFGVFTGTFSSIYIASPVLMAIEQRWPGAAGPGPPGRDADAGAPTAPGGSRSR